MENETQAAKKGQPLTLTWKQWALMVALYILVIALTAYKDLFLTGVQPNLLYYSIVPVLTVLGAATGGFLAARYFKLHIGYLDVLFVTLATNFIGQVMEISAKLISYRIWAYPSWLYGLLVVIPMATIIPAYLFLRWAKLPWAFGLVLGVTMVLGGVFVAAVFISTTGIYTPGS